MIEDRFKFRAWSKECNSMEYDIEDPLECERCFSEILKNKDYVIMQSTGLRDKNGNLIYEGDYLKVFGCISGSEKKKFYLAKVVWEERGMTGFELVLWHNNEWWGWGGIDYTEGIEIIGNRFENPELLPARQAGGKGK